MTVVYDKRFETFLALVYDVYYKKITPTAIVTEMPTTLFTQELYLCEPDDEKSEKVLAALRKKFTRETFSRILNVFMCDTNAFEMALLEYIVLGFRSSKQLQDINHPSVFAIEKLEKELFRNVHKMTGFLRFEELEDGALYARVESKFDLVYYLGRHFSKRFSDQLFFIHDIRRRHVFIHSKRFKGVREVVDFEEPTRSLDEQKFKRLWKTFFTSVSIESRKNEALQQDHTPLLYRVYMTEFEA